MQVTLLTPDASYEQFRSVWEARIALYVDLLKPHDIEIVPAAWTDARPIRPAWAQLAWGYHLQPARWDALLAAWPDDVPLVNAPALLRWNSDKRYLDELARAGVPVVPTRFVALADEAALAEARAEFGMDELVVKPRISASAAGTTRAGPGDRAPHLADAMIQPFIASVQDQGELSTFFFGGEQGHAVRKVAATGDFRVQREYGGAFTPAEPDADQLAVAQAALAATPGLPLYARVDLVRDAAGQPRLMELELVEPDLYLDLAPDAGAGFAARLAERLRAG
jgi:glutathione synthase/RimK-type ligase-like ATP-grasp enzyme